MYNESRSEDKIMKISELIERIKQWHEPYVAKDEGRDLILGGNPDQQCTGVIITVCATLEVLKKAKEKNCNFIITHESILYGAKEEDMDNDVVQYKKRFMEENGLCVWRDHDRMHGNGLPFQPERKRNDYIFYGLMKELGWEEYVEGDSMKPLWYKIPKMSALDFADLLIEKFHLNGLRLVGNLDSTIETVWFSEHVQGGKMDKGKLKGGLKADAIIPFEIVDFTLTQYVVDAAEMGQNKVLYEMGHFNAEELGMRYMCTWIQDIVKHEVPVEFIQAGDFFQYRGKKA